MKSRLIGAIFACAGLVLFTPNFASAATVFTSIWDASSGLLPDQVDPAYTLVNSASPEVPVLSATSLRLSTSTNSENMTYRQTAPLIMPVDPLVIEADVQYISGASGHIARAPVGIIFTLSPSFGNSLYIGQDSVWLLDSDGVPGTKATVDTDDAFHTYNIELDSLGAINVLYDGSPLLTGNTYSSVSAYGTTERIEWGEVSGIASGTSDWAFVKHNAAVVPLPGAVWLFGSGLIGLIGVAKKRKA